MEKEKARRSTSGVLTVETEGAKKEGCISPESNRGLAEVA